MTQAEKAPDRRDPWLESTDTDRLVALVTILLGGRARHFEIDRDLPRMQADFGHLGPFQDVTLAGGKNGRDVKSGFADGLRDWLGHDEKVWKQRGFVTRSEEIVMLRWMLASGDDAVPEASELSTRKVRSFRKKLAVSVARYIEEEAEAEQGRGAAPPPRSAVTPRVVKAERKAEKRPEWAVDIRGTREWVVNATQRLTLDRTFEVAVVESAGLTRRRLAEAEKLLDVAAVGWTPRYWFPIDASAVPRLDERLTSVRERVGSQRLSLLVHGEESDVMVARELHRGACAALDMEAGPTVVVGPRRGPGPDPSLVWLPAAGHSWRSSAALEQRLDKASYKQRLGVLAADPNVLPLSVLAAIARSGDIGSGRLDKAVDDLLTRSSASVRDAWAVLESGRAADRSSWMTHTREFVALMVRGGGGVGIPLTELPTDLLREPYLYDEILRLRPERSLYVQLIALPEPARRRLGLVQT